MKSPEMGQKPPKQEKEKSREDTNNNLRKYLAYLKNNKDPYVKTYLKTLEVHTTWDDPTKVEMEIDIPMDDFKIKGTFDDTAVQEILHVIHSGLPGYEVGLRAISERNVTREYMKKFLEQHSSSKAEKK